MTAPDRMTNEDIWEKFELLNEQSRELTRDLSDWAHHDDSRADPEARQAANTATDTIDAMIDQLPETRRQLVSEMRQADDATTARADAMLAMSLDERLAAREAAIRAAGGQR